MQNFRCLKKSDDQSLYQKKKKTCVKKGKFNLSQNDMSFTVGAFYDCGDVNCQQKDLQTVRSITSLFE